jgi:hypothetical protein
MNKYEEKPLGKVTSKIYLYAYPGKKTGYELSKLIYPKSRRKVLPSIKRENLIERKYFDYEEVKNKDGKLIKSFVKSRVDPLLKIIDFRIQRPNLSDFDKYVIRNILDSTAFRKLVKESTKTDVKIVYPMYHILSVFDLVVILSEKNREILEKYNLSIDFQNKEEYDKFLSIYPNIKDIIPEVIHTVTLVNEKIQFLKEMGNLLMLTVPKKQEKKLKQGITSIGKHYRGFQDLYKGFSKLDSRTEKIIKNKFEYFMSKIKK